MTVRKKPSNTIPILLLSIVILVAGVSFGHFNCRDKRNEKIFDLKNKIDSVQTILNLKRESFDKSTHNTKEYTLIVDCNKFLTNYDQELNYMRKEMLFPSFLYSMDRIEDIEDSISRKAEVIRSIEIPKKTTTKKKQVWTVSQVRYKKLIPRWNSAFCRTEINTYTHKYYFSSENIATDLNVQFVIPKEAMKDSVICGLVKDNLWYEPSGIGQQKILLETECCFKRIVKQINTSFQNEKNAVRIGFKIFHPDGTVSIITEPQIWLIFSGCPPH